MIYDLLIKNGFVIDGTGNPWFRADVAISEGRIVKVGRVGITKADGVIDARGLIVSPGFIDIHSHSDLSLLINPLAESKIRQGVTTEVIGNCGGSPAPTKEETLELLKQDWGLEAKEVDWNWSTFGEYLEQMEKKRIALNVASLVGHGTVRTTVLGVQKKPPTTAELEEMKALVRQSMEAGVFGMSTGLVYLPGCFADTSELIELCKVVAEYGGLYASHIRGERETIVEALKEAIEIGEKAGLRVQVSHNCPKWGGSDKLHEIFRIFRDARARGVAVTMDNDAHTDFSAELSSILPQWAQAGGVEKVIKRLRDPETREKIKEEIVDDKYPGPGYCGLVKHGRWERVFLFQCHKNKHLIGKSFEEIARMKGATNPFDAYFDLLIEEEGDASALFNYISEDDIRTVLRFNLMMISTDGSAYAPYGPLGKIGGYSPCSYGEYPYILERYVRKEKIIAPQEAIRKMTSFPAQKLGLRDRGLVREGMWADIVVLNLDEIKDRATSHYPYTFPLPNYPHKYPEGLDYVLVNGQVVVVMGEHRGALPGKVLRHQSKKQ
ncbi:MAG: D-aminoacylase [Candidatus Bathyarchaeota archaeon]